VHQADGNIVQQAGQALGPAASRRSLSGVTGQSKKRPREVSAGAL
jgi:hypothetical protein